MRKNKTNSLFLCKRLILLGFYKKGNNKTINTSNLKPLRGYIILSRAYMHIIIILYLYIILNIIVYCLL